MKRLIPFEGLLAFRYLRSPRQGFVSLIAFFSFLGILLGVATLIVVTSVMNGFRTELLSKLIGMRGHILIYGNQIPLTTTNWDENTWKNDPDIRAYYPIGERQAILLANGQARGVNIQGVQVTDLWKRSTFQCSTGLTPGQLQMPRTILLGKRLLELLNLQSGTIVQLMIPNGRLTAVGTFPKTVPVRIVGTFEVGMHDFDKNFAYMDLHEFQRLFQMGQQLSHLELFVQDPQCASRIATR